MTQPDNPFKGLQPYEREDSAKLFGRERDLVLVKDRIYSGRTTLLFAGSGVGKTSFLNAKLIPDFEDQYCVFYHNQWAGPAQPLESVKATLKKQLDVSVESPLIETFRRFQVSATETSVADSIDGIRPHSRCLLIFDQFEEIFQYHAYEDYFKQFLSEICEVIRTDDYRVHVVFSMREEFLGELSVFDNLIPDLFGNYYRLKHPDKGAARDIIEGTCALSKTAIDKDKLAQLIRDLSKIDKGAAGGVERSTGSANAAEHLVERDFVIPPFLQVVCQRQWDAEAAKVRDRDGFVFLQQYEPNRAQQILRDFCYEKLANLTLREQNRAAQAFDYLVTKQGAKMAYEFRNLADRMRIRFSRRTLRHALDKLSDKDTRILRKSHGPDKSVWFELYHDIYGRILDDWRETFRQRKQRLLVGTSIGLCVFVFAMVLVSLHWVVYPWRYRIALKTAHLESAEEYSRAYQAFSSLFNTFGYQRFANNLWAEGWERRAHYAETHNKRDDAIISWLNALRFSPAHERSEYWRRKIGNLVADDYAILRGTLHHENPIESALFSEDGRLIVTMTGNQKIWVWNGITGEPLGEHGAVVANSSSGPANKEAASAALDTAQHRDELPSRDFSQEEYQLLAAATDPQIGWLVATVSTTEWSRLQDPKRKSAGELRISILSKHDELLAASPSIEVKPGSYLYDFRAVFSPNGKYLITTGRTTSNAWKLLDGRFVPYNGFDSVGIIYRATFSADGLSLLLLNKKKQLFVWDVASERLRFPAIEMSGSSVNGFSADGKSFATLVEQTPSGFEIQLRDSLSGTLLSKLITTSLPPGYDVIFPDIDQKVVLVNSSQRQMLLADTGAGRLEPESSIARNPIRNFREYLANPFIVSRSTGVALDCKAKDAQLLTIRRPQTEGALRLPNELNTATLAEDGQTFTTVTSEKSAHPKLKLPHDADSSLYRINLGAQDSGLSTILVATAWNAETLQPASAAFSDINCVSPDGKYAVRPTDKKDRFDLVDTRMGTTVKTFVSKRRIPVAIDLNATHRFFVATVVEEKYLSAWRLRKDLRQDPNDISAGAFEYYDVWDIAGEETPISALATNDVSPNFTANGQFLITRTRSGLSVQDLFAKQPVPIVNSFVTNTVSSNASAKMIAASSKLVRIWELPSGTQLYNDIEVGGSTVAISPNSQIAFVADNGTESLWKFTINRLPSRVGEDVKHDDVLWSARFSANGNTIVLLVGDWLHVISASDHQYLASYFLGTRWMHQCTALNGSSNQFRCLFKLDDKSVYVTDLNNESVGGVSPLQGEPAALYDGWRQKLALKINDLGQAIPVLGSATTQTNQ
jgi:WD40 repeat protein